MMIRLTTPGNKMASRQQRPATSGSMISEYDVMNTKLTTLMIQRNRKVSQATVASRA